MESTAQTQIPALTLKESRIQSWLWNQRPKPPKPRVWHEPKFWSWLWNERFKPPKFRFESKNRISCGENVLAGSVHVSSKQSGGNSGLKSQLWNCALVLRFRESMIPRISPGKCWLERLIVSRFKSRKLRCEHAITCGAAKRFQVSTLEVWMDTSLSGRNQLWNVFCFQEASLQCDFEERRQVGAKIQT